MNRREILPLVVFLSLLLLFGMAVLSAKTTFNFNAEIDGFFILEGEGDKWFELTDDLTPEDAHRLIWSKPIGSLIEKPDSALSYKWDKKDGHGFIKYSWQDGSKIVINLSRFRESNGKYPSGLFIGGGLPPSEPDYEFMNNEETGMAYFNGIRWFHIWCNVNEGIHNPANPFIPSYPSDWKYMGSSIREDDGKNLTIESRHRIVLDGIPLDLNRTLFYTAGDKYVILETEITNMGYFPSKFTYLYGDEPWIGNFGSSAGDVGWIEGNLLFSEYEADTQKNSFIGMFDFGNPLAKEGNDFTGTANFIEWDKRTPPSKAYISNFSGGITQSKTIVPLVSKTNRFLGLQWGPLTVNPKESYHFIIAVGMADNDPKTGMPIKPKTELNGF